MFYHAIRRDNAKVAFEVAAVANRLLQHFLKGRAIVSMNSVHKRSMGRRHRVRIQSKRAKELGRPRHLSGGQVPGPASGSADSLAFGQKRLTTAQLVLCTPAL